MIRIARPAFAVLLAATTTWAAAQDYPTKPVRFIIATGPGGLMDTVLSVTNPILEARFGQRILVENRAGSGGNVGAQAVLAAPADGYTLMVAPSNVLVTNQFLIAKPPFDPLKEFVPITGLVDVPLVFTISGKLPWSTLKDLVDHVRANPGKVNFASPGPGTPPHLAGELFNRAANLQAVHVPYKGGNAAAVALIANDVQFFVVGYATLRGQIQGGLVRPIAVAASERLPALPNVPTVAQSGYPEIGAELPRSWWGLFAPRGTPQAVIERMNAGFREALAAAPVQTRLREAGLVSMAGPPAELGATLPAQAAKWQSIVRALDLKFE